MPFGKPLRVEETSLGGQVIADLVRQAGMIGARFGLRVDRDSRARALFERLGLRVVGEDEEQFILQTHPESLLAGPI